MTGPRLPGASSTQHDPDFYAAVSALLDRLRVAFPTRRDVKSHEVFSVYGAALSGLDLSAFPHAADSLIRTLTFFPKPAEVRDAVLGVMRRYTNVGTAPAVAHGWSGRPDEPCTVCGTRCEITALPCEYQRCRDDIHVHWWYEAPTCECAWPAGQLRPCGWVRDAEAALITEALRIAERHAEPDAIDDRDDADPYDLTPRTREALHVVR